MTAPYEKRVFINCPFDERYKKLFDAIVFAVHDLGFQARHGLIAGGDSIRLTRIANEIANCKFSVHDISRVELSGSSKLPRFNMPFEAGLAYCRHHQNQRNRPHYLLLLDEQPFRYHASLSDASGLDPKIHAGDPRKIIKDVRAFLSGYSEVALPGATHVARRFDTFNAALANAARRAKQTLRELREWDGVIDLQTMMVRWIGENPS
jgi:hypothetical protein